VAAAVPVITSAMPFVGHVATQSRGTFGGSVAHADPAAEIPALLLALDADILVAGPAAGREISARDFFPSYYTTALEDSEMITAVRIPVMTSEDSHSLRELTRRHGDFALAGVVALVTFGHNSVVHRARLSLFGVSESPVRATEAEAFLSEK